MEKLANKESKIFRHTARAFMVCPHMPNDAHSCPGNQTLVSRAEKFYDDTLLPVTKRFDDTKFLFLKCRTTFNQNLFGCNLKIEIISLCNGE